MGKKCFSIAVIAFFFILASINTVMAMHDEIYVTGDSYVSGSGSVIEIDLNNDGVMETVHFILLKDGDGFLTIYSEIENVPMKDEVLIETNSDAVCVYIAEEQYIVVRIGLESKNYWVFNFMDKKINLVHSANFSVFGDAAKYKIDWKYTSVKEGNTPTGDDADIVTEYNSFSKRFEYSPDMLLLYDSTKLGNAAPSEISYSDAGAFYQSIFEDLNLLKEEEMKRYTRTLLIDLDNDGKDELLVFRLIGKYNERMATGNYRICQGLISVYDADGYTRADKAVMVAIKDAGGYNSDESYIYITEDNYIINHRNDRFFYTNYYYAYQYQNGIIESVDSTWVKNDHIYYYEEANNYKQFREQYVYLKEKRYLFNNSLQQPENNEDNLPKHDIVSIYRLSKASTASVTIDGTLQEYQVPMINGVSYISINQLSDIGEITISGDGGKINIERSGISVIYEQDSNKYECNNELQTLADSNMHFIDDSEFYVPLGITLRHLGFDVGWNGNDWTVIISR